jgi:hypothetical protein
MRSYIRGDDKVKKRGEYAIGLRSYMVYNSGASARRLYSYVYIIYNRIEFLMVNIFIYPETQNSECMHIYIYIIYIIHIGSDSDDGGRGLYIYNK